MIQHFQPVGRKCYVHIPEGQRGPGSKLLPRGLEGCFIGYTESTKTFRIYIASQHKVVETRQGFRGNSANQNHGHPQTVPPLGSLVSPAGIPYSVPL